MSEPVDDAPRAWQRMLSGRRLDLLDPDPADIEIADIAHGLARVARWNGQTTGAHAFTVAQHSLIVAEICVDLTPDWPNRWQRAALLHDAAEYVVGDLISPIKSAISSDYKEIELRLMRAIHLRFDLPETLPGNIAQRIKTADQIAAFYEATRLAGFSVKEAQMYFAFPENELSAERLHALENLVPDATEHAQEQFMLRFAGVAD